MAKNPISVIKEAEDLLDNLNKKLKETNNQLLAISDRALKSDLKNFFDVKSPKEVNERLKLQREIIEQINNQSKERQKIEKAILRQTEKKKAALSELNKELIKQRFETQQINKTNKEAAILSSKLSSEYQKLVVRMNQSGRTVQNLIAKKARLGTLSKLEQKELVSSQKSYKNYRNSVIKADKAIDRFQRNVGNYGNAFNKARFAFKSFVGIFGVLSAGIIAKGVFEDVKQLDSLNKALVKVTGTSTEYAKVNAFLLEKAKAYGIEIKGLTKEYTKFLAGLKGTNLEGEKGQKIFDKVIKTSAALGSSQEEINGILNAFTQIISKGTVQAEELRGQLGDRLPGAFNIMARAIGVSVEELNEMLKKGEVIADEVLPKFADELENTFGVKSVKKINTVVGAQNRLGNAWTQLIQKIESGEGRLSKFFIGALNVGEKLIRTIGGIDEVTTSYVDTIKDEQVELNTLVSKIIETNEGEANRKKLMNDLIEKYPFLLQYIKDEKADNNNLKDALKEVNALYIKRLAIARLQEKIDLEGKTNQLADATGNLGKTTNDYRKYLNALNLALYGKDAEVLTGSLNSQEKALKSYILSEQERISIAKANGKATETEIKNLPKLQNLLNGLATATKVYNKAISSEQSASNVFNDAKKEIEELEKSLGITTKQIEDYFDQEAIVLNVNVGDNDEDEYKKIQEQLLKDAFELAKSRLIIQKDNFKAILEDENSSLSERLKAQLEYSNKSEELIDLEAEYAISKAEGRENAIKLIEEKAEHDKSKILDEGVEKRNEIYESDFKKRVNFFEKMQEKEKLNLDNHLIDLTISLREQGKTEEEIAKEIEKAKKKSLKQQLKDQIEYAVKELEVIAQTSEEKQEIYKKITALRQELLKLEKDADSNSSEELIKLSKDFGSEIVNLTNSLFDNKIQKYEDDINRNNDYYAAILDNAELTEEQRSALEAERDRKNKELEKKQRQQQRKQAIFNKAIAGSEIVINTAKAISKVSPNPLLIALAAAIGAAQLATVVAQPIPAYEKGKGEYDNYEGVAVWGEKRQEAKISKDGSIELSPKKIGNHLTHVKKDDIIHPDASKFLSSLTDEQIYNDIHKVSILASMSHQSETIKSYLVSQESAIHNQTKQLVNAFKQKKAPKINLYNNNNIADDIAFILKKESRK